MVTYAFEFFGKALKLGPLSPTDLGHIWVGLPVPRTLEEDGWTRIRGWKPGALFIRLQRANDLARRRFTPAGTTDDDLILGLVHAIRNFGALSIQRGSPELGNSASWRIMDSLVDRLTDDPELGIRWLDMSFKALSLTMANLHASLAPGDDQAPLDDHAIREAFVHATRFVRTFKSALGIARLPFEQFGPVTRDDLVGAEPELVETYEILNRAGKATCYAWLACLWKRWARELRREGAQDDEIRERVGGATHDLTVAQGGAGSFLMAVAKCSVEQELSTK